MVPIIVSRYGHFKYTSSIVQTPPHLCDAGPIIGQVAH
jgi:hypothetical protein